MRRATATATTGHLRRELKGLREEKRKATIAVRAAQPSSRLDQLLGCCVSTKNRNIYSV